MKLILLFLCIEMMLRAWSGLVPNWYQQAINDVRKNPVKYIFIGSSRVACSIVPTEFAKTAGDTNPAVSALNMGLGYSTLVEHYFGLRRITAAIPDGLKGVTVFLEAPEGVPDLETWQGKWLYPDHPYLLVNTIGLSNLGSFWAKDSSDFDSKLLVTASRLSEVIASQGNGWRMLERLKRIMLRNRTEALLEKADLSNAGGVRTDEAGIRNARRLAPELVAAAIKKERLFPCQSGNETILKSLNDFINAEGGRLVLYRMPISSIQKQIYTTAIGRKNQGIAHELLKTWAIPMLSPSINTNDDDFPDYWHLRKSRTSELTRSLAQAYVELGGTFPGTMR